MPSIPRSSIPETPASVEAPGTKTDANPRKSAMPNSAGRTGESDAVHGMLTQRIAELQQERQGYWQKIIGMINK